MVKPLSDLSQIIIDISNQFFTIDLHTSEVFKVVENWQDKEAVLMQYLK